MATRKNGLLQTKTSGSYRVDVIGIRLGINIVSSSGEAKRRKVHYTATTTASSFSLMLVFRSYEARESFNKWMRRFMERTVDSRGFSAAILVQCPVRKFTRSAIPMGPLTYGEKVDDVTYPVTIDFIGASDPLEIAPGTREQRSYFQMPASGRNVSKYFYPAGVQLQGAGALDGPIYGPVAPDPNPDVYDPGSEYNDPSGDGRPDILPGEIE